MTREDVFRDLIRAHRDCLGLRVSEDEVERYWLRRWEKAEFYERLKARHEDEAQLYDRLSGVNRDSGGDRNG